jgi:hypothetical protein
MNSESQHLLERLQAGWIPTAADISPMIEQGTLTDWKVVVGTRNKKLGLFGNTGLFTDSGKPWFDLTAEVMFMNLELALCADDKLWWLG